MIGLPAKLNFHSPHFKTNILNEHVRTHATGKLRLVFSGYLLKIVFDSKKVKNYNI